METTDLSLSEVDSIVRFDLVIFTDVQETYSSDSPLKCTFTIHSALGWTTSDCIRLYKVGWASINDYVCSAPVAVPHDDQNSQSEVTGMISFAAHLLPTDDGEFYHFCYVVSSGQIRGVSTPFQFVSDDFEVIDDKNSLTGAEVVPDSRQLILVKNNNSSDENEISELKRELSELRRTHHDVEIRLNSEIQKALQLGNSQATLEIVNEGLLASLRISEEKISDLEGSRAALQIVNEELLAALRISEEKISDLEGSRAALQIANEGLVERLSKQIKINSELERKIRVSTDGSSQKCSMDLNMTEEPEKEADVLVQKESPSLENELNNERSMNSVEINQLPETQVQDGAQSEISNRLGGLQPGICTYEDYPDTLYPLPTWFPNPFINYVPTIPQMATSTHYVMPTNCSYH